MNNITFLKDNPLSGEKFSSEEHLVKRLGRRFHISNVMTSSTNYFDIGTFSKALNIKGMGRNKMYQWLRDEGILMKTNIPHLAYLEYFSVVPVMGKNFTSSKISINPCGVDFLIKRLIKDGKVVTKSLEDVLKELNN